METGDIVNELSTSNIVEDDLNGIFSSLEPLEDPKDDMFFFGGKDLLQKIREKNPANTIITVHRTNSANKPMPHPSHASASTHASMALHAMVPTASCDTQPSLAPLAHHDKPIGCPDAKNLSSAAIASASASAMYLDNYLAATTASSHNKQPPTLTPVPPPLLPAVHDKLTKAHHASILRRTTHKASSRNPLSKSHPGYANNSGLAVPHASADQKRHESHPLSHSTTTLTNSNLNTSQNATHTLSATHANAHYAATSPTVSKRNRASYLKNSSELKHSRIIYNPNTANTSALRSSSEISTTSVVPTTCTTPAQANEGERASYNAVAMSDSMPSSATPTVEVPESAPEKTSNYLTNNTNNLNANCTYISKQEAGHRPAVDFVNYGNYTPYFGYHPNIPVQGFYTTPLQHDASMPLPEPYNPRSDPQVGFDPAADTTPAHSSNHSNDLYSNLYLYSFNNTNAATTRSTLPVPDVNPSYNNIYSYNNLYLNSLYGYPTYPARQYPAHGYHKGSGYDPALYRSTESFEETYEDEGDYRTERSYPKGHSKRSKRRAAEEDEFARGKGSKKSKNRSRSKRNKLPPTYEDGSLLDSSEINTTHSSTMDPPNGETPASSAFSPPLSPAKRAKANLFENTPKIKISDVQGGNTKISKLGRKLLESVNLDWQTPYAQDSQCPSTPVIKTPVEQDAEQQSDMESGGDSKAKDLLKGEGKPQVFLEYETAPDRKNELLYFVANKSLLTMPTKIEVTLNDFKASALGTKVRQRLEVLNTIQLAKEFGLILEGQFASKQKQFLEAFTFGMGNSDTKAT